jgi:pimeloyl-ACP methyl ester carboxylesterase
VLAEVERGVHDYIRTRPWCVARRLVLEASHPAIARRRARSVHINLARPEVDLETHITDVVNVFEYEDLCNVVLLGHSYAGVVVTSVADRIPNRLSQLVYLDTGPLLDGVALIDTIPYRSQNTCRAAGRGAWRRVEVADTTVR